MGIDLQNNTLYEKTDKIKKRHKLKITTLQEKSITMCSDKAS